MHACTLRTGSSNRCERSTQVCTMLTVCTMLATLSARNTYAHALTECYHPTCVCREGANAKTAPLLPSTVLAGAVERRGH
eukprot:16074-Heterococcus_DN1.PRE.1